MKLYETLAADIAASIYSGVLRAGEKLPSVREATAHRGVSASTVFQAYYLLEAQGLVRARDRSGYYVAHGARALPPEADTPSQPTEDAASVNINDLVFDVLESTMRRDVVQLGSAFPSPLLFPHDRLSQSISSTTRNLDPWTIVDELTPGHKGLGRQSAIRYLDRGARPDTADLRI